jgi:hypothetical protein
VWKQHTKQLPRANQGRPRLPETVDSLSSRKVKIFIKDAGIDGDDRFTVSCL